VSTSLAAIQRKKRPYIKPKVRTRHIGQRFGKLTALHFVAMVGDHAVWRFRCDCGKEVEKLITNVKKAPQASCGCASYTGPGFHGHAVGAGTPEYRAWLHMRERCLNPNDRDYADYGGRGITVCDRWNDFAAFLEDMGPRKSGTSIDRKNMNSNYTPENCRWATATEQARNRRSTRWFFYKGKSRCLTELIALASVSHNTVRKRLNKGWPIVRALHEAPRHLMVELKPMNPKYLE
jgi:hypothetical protein